MSLDVFPSSQRNFSARVATQQGWGSVGLDLSLEDSFEAAWNSVGGSFRMLRVGSDRYEVVQSWLDQLEELTGNAPPNPETAMTVPERRRLYEETVTRYEALKKTQPDTDFRPPPTAEEAHATAIENERRRMDQTARVMARPGGFGKAIGGLLGDIAGFSVDPINLGAIAFGGIGARTVLGVMMREAGIGAGATAAISGITFNLNREVDPDYGIGDDLAAIGFAGVGSAALGGTFAGLARVWRRLRDGSALPRHVQDTGNVAMREELTSASNPQRGAGPEAEVAHTRNAREAEAAVIENRELDLPDTEFAGNWRPSRVYAADGRGVDVRYEVVEANTLVTSHFDDMEINPDYPAVLQPRDRTRSLSNAQVSEIAAKLEPDRLGPSPDAGGGAPIVGPDDLVESGNGRVLALRRALTMNGERAAGYRTMLSDFGFNTEGMQAPVLIARRVTPLDEVSRASFADAANRATALRLSAVEQALADARLVDGPLLEKLTDKGLSTQANADFTRGFLSKLAPAERGGLMDRQGRLSQEGVKRAEAALLARAYGDPALLGRMLEDTDVNIKAIGGALTDVAGPWSGLRDAVAAGRVPAGMDITPDLLAAVRLVQRARDTRAKLADLVNQAELFEAPSPVTKALLRLMFRDEDLTRAASRPAVERGLAAFAEEARKNTTDARLFGDSLEADEVLSTALSKAGREDLLQLADEATTPDMLATRLEEPVTDDAVLHDVEHLVDETPDLAIPVRSVDEFGNEAVTMRPVREMMDEADAEIAAAKDIEACASGAANPAAA